MKNNRLIGGTLLISGTTIGAGMLALPIATGMAGFFPALLIFIICWLLMFWSGCLFLEVNLCFKEEVNLISMAQQTLGSIGESVAWAGFLLLLYSLIAAYIAASGPIFKEVIEGIFGIKLADWVSLLPIIAIFGPFVYFGLRSVDYLNRYLMIGLVLAYVALIFLLSPHVSAENLGHVDSSFALLSFALVITSFGYHIIIPSLTTYLGRDVNRVKTCIILGSFFPLVVYVIWEFLILGNLAVTGDYGIAAIIKNDAISESVAIETALSSPTIGNGMRAFKLFAIVTSFLGVAQSLFDFLRDGLKAHHSHGGRFVVWILTFLPPLIFVLLLDKGFEKVLEYAGVFVAILIGIVPIMMSWSTRYIKKMDSEYRAFGGRPALIAGFIAYALIVVLVFGKNLGYVQADLSRYLS